MGNVPTKWSDPSPAACTTPVDGVWYRNVRLSCTAGFPTPPTLKDCINTTYSDAGGTYHVDQQSLLPIGDGSSGYYGTFAIPDTTCRPVWGTYLDASKDAVVKNNTC